VKSFASALGMKAAEALVFAVVLVAVLIVATIFWPDAEQETLNDINNGTKATVCVLALPVDGNTGRDQRLVDACLIRYGLEP
jgi:hypothetical protein